MCITATIDCKMTAPLSSLMTRTQAWLPVRAPKLTPLTKHFGSREPLQTRRMGSTASCAARKASLPTSTFRAQYHYPAFINSAGVIAGYWQDKNGAYHGFVLIP